MICQVTGKRCRRGTHTKRKKELYTKTKALPVSGKVGGEEIVLYGLRGEEEKGEKDGRDYEEDIGAHGHKKYENGRAHY